MVVPDKAAPNKGTRQTTLSSETIIIINLDQGDPALFEPYWRRAGEKSALVIPGNDVMSYFSDGKEICWFLEPQLAEAIKRLHHGVGNAVTDDHHIVVGSGSTQLFQAALYALCSPSGPEPISVVGAAPYYSCYPELTDLLHSRLHKWAGDAYSFDKDEPYIEVVTSPNNPDGALREAVVNRADGKVIHDLAYYWPHYTPITRPADHDIMLFTFSKLSGHAGSRIGWALVKDVEVAKKMVEYMTISSIGVSKEAQLRAANIFGVISDECRSFASAGSENFFECSRALMAERWGKLRVVVKQNEVFTLPKFSLEYCNFARKYSETYPAFAWLKCKEGIDCEELLRAHKIRGRGGERFGVGPNFARISLMSTDYDFNIFVERISAIEVPRIKSHD